MIYNLFGFQGRIGRFGWWMTQFFIVAIGVGYNLFFGAAPPQPSIPDPKTMKDAAVIITEALTFYFQDPVAVGIQVFSHWLFACTTVQRLHDRDNSGGRFILYYVPLALVAYGIYLFTVPHDLKVGFVCLGLGFVGIMVSSVWLLVECGMLRGDDTDNDYGPPPGAESRRNAFHDELEALGDSYVRSKTDESGACSVAAASGRLFGGR